MTLSSYQIRKATHSDAEAIAHVHVKGWQTSYVGMIEQSYLDAISHEKRLELRKKILDAKDILALAVIHGEEVIGFADAGPLHEKAYNKVFVPTQGKQFGEIYAIYLLREHQRKGLGHQLYQECRQWFKEQGYHGFVTWGLINNTGARQFYEKEGGKIVAEMRVTMGDKDYEEYCYSFEIS